jgi:hypothetical protein
MTRTPAHKTRVFVDAIEDQVARLLVEEESFTLPKRLLPDDTREGDWVVLTIGRAAAPPDDTQARRGRLAGGDPGGDIEL